MHLFKTLLYARFASLAYAVTGGGRTRSGKAQTKAGRLGRTVGFGLLYAYCGIVFLFMFGMLFHAIAPVYGGLRLGWLYFTLAFIIAGLFQILGSVFMAKAQLYEAKDNALLLSMPIPPTTLLLVRMAFLYILNLIYGGMVLLPAVVIWFWFFGFSPWTLFSSVTLFLGLSLFSLAISALLGFVLARITARMRSKTLVSVVLSLAFIVAYYAFVGSGFSRIMHTLLNEGEALASTLGALAPLYAMGHAISDRAILSFLSALSFLVLPFVLVLWVMSKTYFSTITHSHDTARVAYKRERMDTAFPFIALLARENKRLLSSSAYLLNAGMAVFLLLLASGALLFKKNDLDALTAAFPSDMIAGFLPFIAPAMLSMAIFSAPSVSLEGRTLWILRAMPVPTRSILLAKAVLHVLWCIPPSLVFCTVCWVLLSDRSPILLLWMIALSLLYAIFTACLDLMFGILFARLDWTTEVQPIKQGTATMLAMLGNMTVAALPFLLVVFLKPGATLACAADALFLATGTALTVLWLSKWGVRRFEAL